tara:strand:- start:4090 stop:4953 length:864 start_codon:yes stop_codon:yes gene_type:complete
MFGASHRLIWNKVSKVKRELSFRQSIKGIFKYPGVFSKCIQLKKNIENTELQYPNYFTTHSDGNMNWQAAFKAEYYIVGISDPVISEQTFRNNITELIDTYRNIHEIIEPPTHILDFGCSIGGSTEFLKYKFRNSNIWGIDLNPYFLAVAEFRKQLYSHDINYIHANAEQILFFDNNTVDIVTMTFLFHEIPTESTIKILNESMRVLKHGGTLHIIDIEPNHSLIDCHSRSHNYEYYKNDMTEILISCGFHNVVKYKSDQSISVLCAIKPDNEEYSINNNIYNFVEN